MQIYMPSRGVHTFIDFHGRVPGGAGPSMWEHLVEGETRDGFGFILKGRVNDIGYQSITVPGSLKAFFDAQTEFGSMDWKDAMAPAIRHAEEGFVVRPHVHGWWTQGAMFGRVGNLDRLRFTESGRRIYFGPDGAVKAPGERVANPDMA